MIEEFAAFILTHGRPDRVYTYKTLRKHGYTGKIYIVIDSQDNYQAEYIKEFGDQVIVFDKAQIANTFDEGDNFKGQRGVVYARNACFEIAKQVGVKYFIQLDDDYLFFYYKFDSRLEYTAGTKIKNLDRVFKLFLEYYKSIPALSIAMAQNGDFIGGKDNQMAVKKAMTRKVMNTFFMSTDRPFTFVGRINEDVNAYIEHGNRGGLFLTIPLVAIAQKQTQSNAEGMTTLYLDYGTYVKSFYSVMYQPSFVKISEMGDAHRRIHHHVSWNNAVPVILEEKYKKRLDA